jgi:hypothetical protein
MEFFGIFRHGTDDRRVRVRGGIVSPRARRTLLAVTTVLATMVLAAGCNATLAEDLAKGGTELVQSSDDVTRIAERVHASPGLVESTGRQLATGAPAGVVEVGREVDNSRGWKLLKVACQMSDLSEWLTADSDSERRAIVRAQLEGDEAEITKIGLMADGLAKSKNAAEASYRVGAAITCTLADQKAG